MTALTAAQIPADFEELLKALCMAGKIERPLALHDETLRAALHARGLIAASGTGFVGAAVLDDMMKLPGAVQLIALLLQQPAPGVRPSFGPAQPAPAPLAVPKRRIELSAYESGLLRHAQVLGVHMEGLQRELDQLLEMLNSRFDEIEDPEQLASLAKQLPTCLLRQRLLERAGLGEA